jgi:putative PIN family toxin of toxin-antitoxin system
VKRVVADSNILSSAFLWGGKPLELIELARAGQIELAVSHDILKETGRVLRDKFSVPDVDIAQYGQEISGFAIHVIPTEKLNAVPADPADNPIVECAVAANAETVVTGDGHLLSIRSFRGIKIQRVGEFLAEERQR